MSDWHSLDKARRYLEEIKDARQSNRCPAVQDVDFIEELVASENDANPQLKLGHHKLCIGDNFEAARDSGLVERIINGIEEGRDWRAVLDTGNHRLAMSARHDEDNPRNISVFIVNSLKILWFNVRGWQKSFDQVAKAVNERLGPDEKPVKIVASLAGTEVQKTPEGCSIFALSAAKKMEDNPAVEAIHREALNALKKDGESAGGRTVNALRHLDPSFFKHATSPNVVNAYLRAQPDEVASRPVNREEQTLQKRQEAHMINRKVGDSLRRYSNSYEGKRLSFFTRAVDYMERRKGE